MRLLRNVLPLLSRLTLAVAHANQIPLTSPGPSNEPPVSIPPIGFGTWNLRISSSNTTAAVAAALKAGYRHIDGAKAYGNQVAVGAGIKEGLEAVGAKREDIWVTSKLFNNEHGEVEVALNRTLGELGVGYLDLYLMHWPVGQVGENSWEWDYVETWQAMEKLLDLGTVRNIGVSNFAPRELFRLLRSAKIKPYNHQFEIHPYLQQTWWVKWHEAHGITVTGYSPLANTNPIYEGKSNGDGEEMDPHISCADETEDDVALAKLEYGDAVEQSRRGRPNTYPPPPPLLDNTVVAAIAEKHGCTPAQIALAWGMKRGYTVIPKSSHVKYIEQDWESIACVDKLDFIDMKKLEYVGERWLHRFNNPGKNWNKKLFAGLDGHDYGDKAASGLKESSEDLINRVAEQSSS